MAGVGRASGGAEQVWLRDREQAARKTNEEPGGARAAMTTVVGAVAICAWAPHGYVVTPTDGQGCRCPIPAHHTHGRFLPLCWRASPGGHLVPQKGRRGAVTLLPTPAAQAGQLWGPWCRASSAPSGAELQPPLDPPPPAPPSHSHSGRTAIPLHLNPCLRSCLWGLSGRLGTERRMQMGKWRKGVLRKQNSPKGSRKTAVSACQLALGVPQSSTFVYQQKAKSK